MRIATREILPQRRSNETFTLRHDDRDYTVTLGFFEDGSLGEVFLNGAKAGSDMEAVMHDGAVLLSLLIQHAIPLRAIKHAITRDEDGQPETIIGAVVDKITEGE